MGRVLGMVTDDLAEALGLGTREMVALVGGGGKSTLMFALAENRRLAGYRVVTGTTAKVWHKEARRSPGVVLTASSGWRAALLCGLEKRGEMFLGQGLLESGKVEGIPPGLADALYQDLQVDYLILEADGSAGRPLKAPAAHEPVIPALTSLVVALTGLDVLGKPLDSECVFRPERFASVTGMSLGEALTPAALAKIYHVDDGLFKGAPARARKAVFLNKLDALPSGGPARELCREILEGGTDAIERVILGSIKKKQFQVFTRRSV